MDSVRGSGVVKFHCVDDGRKDSVGDWSELRYLPPSLAQLPPHCLTVRLNSVQHPHTEAVNIIYLGERKGDRHHHHHQHNLNIVECCILYPGYPLVELIGVEVDSNSSEETQPANCRSTPLVVGQKETLLVVHVVSPREVYLVKEIEEFYNFLLEVNKKAERLEYKALFRPEVGSLVFVQGSDDIWYRGEVLSVDGETFKFFGVDFGFTETASLTRARDIQKDHMKEAKYFGKNY